MTGKKSLFLFFFCLALACVRLCATLCSVLLRLNSTSDEMNERAQLHRVAHAYTCIAQRTQTTYFVPLRTSVAQSSPQQKARAVVSVDSLVFNVHSRNIFMQRMCMFLCLCICNRIELYTFISILFSFSFFSLAHFCGEKG